MAKRRHEQPRDATVQLGDDVLNLIGTYASCQELCALESVSHRFKNSASCDSLWTLRALDILHEQELAIAKDVLHCSSFRQVVEAFTRVGIPCGVLGLWRAIVPTRSWASQLELSSRWLSTDSHPVAEECEARGELLRIKLAAGGFLCESIAADGSARG